MTHTLRLELSEDVFRSLVKIAEEAGKSPEVLAVERLSAIARRPEVDPLEQFIGAFPSPAQDWVDRHDEYLGQGAMKKMRRSKQDS